MKLSIAPLLLLALVCPLTATSADPVGIWHYSAYDPEMYAYHLQRLSLLRPDIDQVVIEAPSGNRSVTVCEVSVSSLRRLPLEKFCRLIERTVNSPGLPPLVMAIDYSNPFIGARLIVSSKMANGAQPSDGSSPAD